LYITKPIPKIMTLIMIRGTAKLLISKGFTTEVYHDFSLNCEPETVYKAGKITPTNRIKTIPSDVNKTNFEMMSVFDSDSIIFDSLESFLFLFTKLMIY